MAEINKIQIKRGLDTNLGSITPALGEPIWTTDVKELFIGDGASLGSALIPVNARLSTADFRTQDSTDRTKEISWNLSALTTATTRAITMPDQNIDLTPGTGSFAAAGTYATNAANTFTIDSTDTEYTWAGSDGSVTISGVDQTLKFVNKGNIVLDYDNTNKAIGISVSGAGTMDSWTIQADDTNSATITNGETVDIGGDGTHITTSFATGSPEQLTVTHSTAAGSKHIPTGGSANQVLTYGGSSGTASWSDPSSGFPVADTTGIFQGNTTATKQMKFDVETNVSASTTRTITVPDQDVDLTPDTGTYASASHTHDAFDRASSVLSGATVFSNIVVTDGITTNIATRDLTASDVGAIPTTDTNIVRDNSTETISATWTHTTNGNVKYEDDVTVTYGTGNDAQVYFDNADNNLRTQLGAGVDWEVTDSAEGDILRVSYTTNAADSTVTVGNDLYVTGDLTVNGTTTTVNSTTVEIGDNIIVLNTGSPATPNLDAGIEIERGDSTNVSLYWDETDNYWRCSFGETAASDEKILTTSDLSGYLTSESDTLATVTGRGATTATAISITNTTEATSSSTGALIMSGGIGLAKSLFGAGSGTSTIQGFAIDGGTF